MSPLAITASASAALLAAAGTLEARDWLARMRQRAAARAEMAAIAACGISCRTNLLVPDGQGALLQVDYLLLTVNGVLVVDLRDVEGAVFGGEWMDEWTVLSGPNRFTFANPLSAVYDRVAAIRALVPDTPVDGRVVFSPRATFPKGRPSRVCQLAQLQQEFPTLPESERRKAMAPYESGWERLGKLKVASSGSV